MEAYWLVEPFLLWQFLLPLGIVCNRLTLHWWVSCHNVFESFSVYKLLQVSQSYICDESLIKASICSRKWTFLWVWSGGDSFSVWKHCVVSIFCSYSSTEMYFFKQSFSLRVFIITEFSELLSARWGLSHFQNVVLSLWRVDYCISAFLTCLFVWWDKQFLAGDSQVICTSSILRVQMKWRYLLWCV